MLDVPTLFLTATLLSLLVGAMQAVACVRAESEALSHWAGASLCFGAGCFMVFLRASVPLELSALAGNGLIFLGLGLVLSGVRVFDGRTPHLWLVTAAAGFGTALLAATFAFGDQAAARIAIVSLIVAAWAGMGCVILLQSEAGVPVVSRTIAAVLMCSFALLHLARAAGVLSGALSPDAAMSGNPQAVLLMLAICLAVAWGMGSLFMVLDRLASHDALTGLVNRRMTLQRARMLLEEAQVKRRPLSVLMVDLDHFKSVNDRFGHHMGDDVLRAFARCARSALRAGDFIGRYGGEEFCVVLPGADTGTARIVAERLRTVAQSQMPPIGGREIPVSVTIGTASFVPAVLPGHEIACGDMEDLIQQADHALYEGKRLGRNRVITFSPSGTPVFEINAAHACA
ncbi:GGDEF domain-containing protein [Xanthobacter tagetidis]|nr:GGDEF domain-containing protein [Xanthobacter tagetidis]MBB6307704.1 diguanylate cyclase (GGDEF)-like protein [Xanthobacter tagetidis]